MVSDPNGFTGVTHREEGWLCSLYLTFFNLKNKNHNTQAWPRAKATMQSGQRLEAKCDATEIAQQKAQIMMLKRKYEQIKYVSTKTHRNCIICRELSEKFRQLLWNWD